MLPQGCVKECRGCKHREWTMEQSLDQKHEFLKIKLNPWVDVLQPVTSVENEKRWGYRSKTTLSTFFNGTEWSFGMWSRDELIAIPNCPVHTSSVNRVLEFIKQSIPKSNNFQLAYIVISGAQIVLVLKTKQMPNTNWFTDSFSNGIQKLGIEGFWIHLNPSAGKRIFEKISWHLIWGKPRSVDYNGLQYGPAAFQQLIPELYNQSLLEAQTYFGVQEHDAVIDLYCGTGNSMRLWANAKANVLGIELGGDAIDCARVNVPSASVLRGACRQRVPQIDAWAREMRSNGKRILLYANPPRTGLETEILEWICKIGRPAKIAYLSCSPGTLSKNLTALTNNGYCVRKIIPFDFFPQTIHVECLALLET